MKEFARLSLNSKSLAITTFLGVTTFISKAFLPTPVDKMFLVVQALTFALASLLTGGWGATYASALNGALLSIIRTGFFPFSFIFSVIYGLLIDVSFRIFNVKTDNHVRSGRLMFSLTVSTAITGLISAYITILIGLMPMIPVLYGIIFIMGVINGVIAGYLTSIIWSKYFQKTLLK